MLAPFIELSLPDDRSVTLFAGELIGRGTTAHVRIHNHAVSEVHAMLSLRGGGLELRALGGGLYREPGRRKPLNRIAVQEGLTVWLCDDLSVHVAEVYFPSHVLKLFVSRRDPNTGARVEHEAILAGGVHWLRPDGSIERKHTRDDIAWVHSTGTGYCIEDRATGKAHDLEGGFQRNIGGWLVECAAIPLDDTGSDPTQVASQPLRFQVGERSVWIRSPRRAAVELRGKPAEVLAILLRSPDGIDWMDAAGRVWPVRLSTEEDVYLQRKRWDANVARARKKIRASGSRRELIRTQEGIFRVDLDEADAVEFD